MITLSLQAGRPAATNQADATQELQWEFHLQAEQSPDSSNQIDVASRPL